MIEYTVSHIEDPREEGYAADAVEYLYEVWGNALEASINNDDGVIVKDNEGCTIVVFVDDGKMLTAVEFDKINKATELENIPEDLMEVVAAYYKTTS